MTRACVTVAVEIAAGKAGETPAASAPGFFSLI